MAARVAGMLRFPGMGVTLFNDDVADFLAGAATAADRRVRTAPDGGSKSCFPPMVGRKMTAFSTSADKGRAAARQEGAGDGSSCPRGEPRRQEDGTRPDLSMERILIFCLVIRQVRVLSPASSNNKQKTELVHLYEAFYASYYLTLFSPYFPLFSLILPYFTLFYLILPHFISFYRY